MKMNGSLCTQAWLQNMVLEDSRIHVEGTGNRIVELMKTKNAFQKMIEIDYKQDEKGNQDIEVLINSFILVGNVSYFFEIGNFFIPEDLEWKKHSIEDLPDVIDRLV